MNQTQAMTMILLSLFVPAIAKGAELTILKPDASNELWSSRVGKNGSLTLKIPNPKQRTELPTPIPNITRATMGTSAWAVSDHVPLEFNQDATQATLLLPESVVGQDHAAVTLDFAESSQQFPSGRIVFSALDAEIIGGTAKLESHPGNHRIGFWTEGSDYVQWKYKATRPCKYTVQLTYSLAGPSHGSSIAISVADKSLEVALTPTTSWYRYATIDVGDVYLPKATDYSVVVKCIEQRGNAVMNLKAVTLVPTCEGTMPTQRDNGTVLLHAKDVTANGILLQWEPREIKRTLGYWANPNDYAYWDFVVSTAGAFDVEILQGCGKGHGGSVVHFDFYEFGNDVRVDRLTHTVVDTGHWQGFEPKGIGTVTLKPGKLRLRVSAASKAKGAVMDLRQVLLTPKK